LSKQLARYLNGDIDIESEPEQGTCVKIFFEVAVSQNDQQDMILNQFAS